MSAGWGTEMARLIAWFETAVPPAQPFRLSQREIIANPEGAFAALRREIGLGPTSIRARRGVLEIKLQQLEAILVHHQVVRVWGDALPPLEAAVAEEAFVPAVQEWGEDFGDD